MADDRDFDSTRGLSCFGDHPERWRTLDRHTYQPRQLWYPLANAVTQWENEFHELMLRDSVRMSRFNEAIQRTIEWLVPNRVHAGRQVLRVIDVGAGYGILSYWVVKHFKRVCLEQFPNGCPMTLRVYAIEGNPVTAGEAYRRLADEGMAYAGPRYPLTSEDASVLVCNTASYDFSEYLSQYWDVAKLFDTALKDSAEPRIEADLIVSEIFGSVVDNEDGVAILANIISRHLASDGLVIPFKAQTYLVPVRDHFDPLTDPASIHHQVKSAVKSISPYDIPEDRFNFCYDCVIPREDHLSESQLVQTWTFGPQTNDADTWRITYEWPSRRDMPSTALTFVATNAGPLVGLKGFFEMQLTDPRIGGEPVFLLLDDVAGSTVQRHSDCWKHLYLPIQVPIEITKGDTMLVSYRRSAKHLERDIKYSWTIRVDRLDFSQLQEYKTVRPFMPVRPTHLRDAINRLCSYVEEKVGARLLLPEEDAQSRMLIEMALDQLIRSPGRSDVAMLPEFFLAWPSVEDSDNPTFLWFHVRPGSKRKLFDLVQKSDLPAEGVVYRYLVDNNKDTQKITLRSDTFTGRHEYSDLDEELAASTNPGKHLKANFLSVTVIPASQAFTANAAQVQSMEAAVYLLQSRLLIELLVRDYHRMGEYLGSAEQARVLAHEVGQVAQLLRVGRPDQGLVVWDGAVVQEFLEGTSVEERIEFISDGVFCPLGQAYKAAVHYIEIISDAKTAKTPFDTYFDKPLTRVLEWIAQFTKEACLAHWIRRQYEPVTGLDALRETRALQSMYLNALARPEKFQILGARELEFYNVLMPPQNISSITLLSGERVSLERYGDKLTIWIAKLIAAALMNTLKYATSVTKDKMDEMYPVALVARVNRDQTELTLNIANRWPAEAQEFQPKGISIEGGTALVLKILTRHLEEAGLQGVTYEFAKPDAFELAPEDKARLVVLESDSIVCTTIRFSGVAAAVLLRRGEIIYRRTD